MVRSTLSVSLPNELRERVERIARQEGKTISALVVEALTDYLGRKKEVDVVDKFLAYYYSALVARGYIEDFSELRLLKRMAASVIAGTVDEALQEALDRISQDIFGRKAKLTISVEFED